MSHTRRATTADLSAIRAIQEATLTEPWPELLEPAVEEVFPCFVRESTVAEVVGYLVAIPDGADHIVYVPELAVHPSYQGEGHGSVLLSALVEAFSHYDEVRVTVDATDERARQFYERRGFVVRDRLDGYFERTDGLLMSRTKLNQSTATGG